ncbi:MAG: hypothetical protein ACYC5S_05745 [Thiobacillus sp.]
MTSPPILGYPDPAMTLNDLISGALVLVFGTLTLSRHFAWARLVTASGALVVTASISALAEAAHPLRFVNALLGIALTFAPFMFDGGSVVADAAGVIVGLLLIALSMPRGRIDNQYGAWSRYLL